MSWLARCVGAMRLDVDTFEEVEADRSANLQAAAVVTLAGLAFGLGTLGNGGASGLVWTTLAAWLGWLVWAALATFVGTKLLPGPNTRADLGELLRTVGFSSAPGVLHVFCGLPVVGGAVFTGVSLWMLAGMVVAVRQALDYHEPGDAAGTGTGRALAVCAIGFPLYALLVLGTMLAVGPWPF